MFICKYNEIIIDFAQNKNELLEKVKFKDYTSIEETEYTYVYYDGSVVTVAEMEEIEREKEQERKSKLKMTKRDFFLYVLQPYGVTYQALNQALQVNDTLSACFNLCNHIYRYDTMLVSAIKPMLEALTGQTIDEQQLMAFLDEQFELHNAQD